MCCGVVPRCDCDIVVSGEVSCSALMWWHGAEWFCLVGSLLTLPDYSVLRRSLTKSFQSLLAISLSGADRGMGVITRNHLGGRIRPPGFFLNNVRSVTGIGNLAYVSVSNFTSSHTILENFLENFLIDTDLSDPRSCLFWSKFDV